VDELQLTVAAEGLGISGQTGSVPAVVTGELTSQVLWGVGGEWAQPLGAVGAIPESSTVNSKGSAAALAPDAETTASETTASANAAQCPHKHLLCC
jgi:hypothetical protein